MALGKSSYSLADYLNQPWVAAWSSAVNSATETITVTITGVAGKRVHIGAIRSNITYTAGSYTVNVKNGSTVLYRKKGAATTVDTDFQELYTPIACGRSAVFGSSGDTITVVADMSTANPTTTGYVQVLYKLSN